MTLQASDEVRRAEAADARLRRWTCGTILLLLALGVTTLVPPAPRLLWNASPSAATGLYRVQPGGPVVRGATVVAWAPEPFRALAALRGYLPRNIPLVKRVAAVAGDEVCGKGGQVLVNRRRVALRRRADAAGRVLPWWQGCRTLGRDQFLLLIADAPDSFDGRYFGITERQQIVGRAHLLWQVSHKERQDD